MTDDPISRQAEVDPLEKCMRCSRERETQTQYIADAGKDVPMKNINRSDTISRQAALDALGEEPPVWYDGEDEIAERDQWRRDVAAIKALPAAQPMCEEVSPEEVLEAKNINPASLWNACKLFTFLKKEGYVICKKTL